jgi:fructokinase
MSARRERSVEALAFGEVLFDCFPDRRCLGGAPLNFAWNLRQFGFRVAMVSAVGRDALGAEIRGFLDRAGIEAGWIAEHPEPTGTVDIRLTGGEPDFTINAGVAWDRIELPSLPDERPGMVYFGTVAQRTACNRATLRRLLDRRPRHRFFDMNLRQRYYTDDLILAGLRDATILKCNEAEWEVLRRITGQEKPGRLLERFPLEALALTRGVDGAELHTPEGMLRAATPRVPVVDTVGAGDAFSAALAAGILRGCAPAVLLEAACAAGAAVVQHPGAQIRLPDEIIRVLE